ncbi:MAG: S-adenosylmethionine decarboxylase [Planctomycetota bacterium]|nr:S-adenosylmethionine decarboxylase [Planctomycetota bacterium]
MRARRSNPHRELRLTWRAHALHKGTHLLVDCREVPRDVCLNDGLVLEAMAEGARKAGATVLSQVRYHFGHNSPPGFTAAILLDESHCSAHSYADLGLIALDIFTCGETSPHDVLRCIRERVDLGKVAVREVGRFEVDDEPFALGQLAKPELSEHGHASLSP